MIAVPKHRRMPTPVRVRPSSQVRLSSLCEVGIVPQMRCDQSGYGPHVQNPRFFLFLALALILTGCQMSSPSAKAPPPNQPALAGSK